ncbi:MAG: helix-turn-helix domain-containing protein [Burkholderiaceae bacterium]
MKNVAKTGSRRRGASPGPGRAASAAPSSPEQAKAERLRLGRQVRDLRRAKGLTIPALAARVGRSVGWLSQIERAISPLSITTLQELAAALEVQISWFFSAASPVPAAEADVVVRKANRRRLEFGGAGVHETLLSPGLSGELQLIETVFDPGASTGDTPRERHSAEAGVGLSGRLRLIDGDRTFELAAGDSFSLDEPGSHLCINPGKRVAVVLWVISRSSY